jgi:hypothetical protein
MAARGAAADGSDASHGTGLIAKRPGAVEGADERRDRGTEFLENATVETAALVSENRNFFFEMRPVESALLSPKDAAQSTASPTVDDTAGVTAAVAPSGPSTSAAEGGLALQPRTFHEMPALAWMQMPRRTRVDRDGRAVVEDLLAGMPAGRVGTLRVHRSGRVTMTIANPAQPGCPPVVLEVSCGADRLPYPAQLVAFQQGSSVPGASGADAAAGGRGGEVDMFGAPVAAAMGDGGMMDLPPTCYHLGDATHKLICTPEVDL